MKSCLALTFHGFQNCSELPANPQTARYTLPIKHLEEIVQKIPPEKCCTVSEFVRKREGDWFILTFDDGYYSDYDTVFPILKDRDLKGTFFLTAEKVNSIGYIGVEQIKEMANGGMEIGSHGLTHNYLVSMTKGEAIQEIGASKKKLERQLNREISSFAPVGGHFRKWMLKYAQKAGYNAFATMVPGITNSNKSFFLIKRNHILAHHDESYIARLLKRDKELLVINSSKYSFLYFTKDVLGMRTYDYLKEFFLKSLSFFKAK